MLKNCITTTVGFTWTTNFDFKTSLRPPECFLHRLASRNNVHLINHIAERNPKPNFRLYSRLNRAG